MILDTLKILLFPGLAFLALYALVAQYIDRKLYARMQNRVGPPFIQPLADLVKLFSKETIIPTCVDEYLFKVLPYVAFAGVTTSFLFVPVWSSPALFSYPGDLVIVAYLLTIPTMVLALCGWVSCTAYSIIGGIRCISQLFSYEIPFFISLLIPAILTGTWNISEISERLPSVLMAHPLMIVPVLIAFFISIVALQGKLERKPFDIPDAETEIVAGPFTEYSGRLYGIFRFTLDMEMIVGVSLLAAVFLGGASPLWFIPGFFMYLLKTLGIVLILVGIKTAVARVRIDQMINFGWMILDPLSIIALLFVVIFHIGGM